MLFSACFESTVYISQNTYVELDCSIGLMEMFSLTLLSSTISPVSNATAILQPRVVQHLDFPVLYASVQIYFRLCHFPERLIQLKY